jgi:thymidine kinase
MYQQMGIAIGGSNAYFAICRSYFQISEVESERAVA